MIDRTLGVDLAAVPRRTAMAVIEWSPGSARVTDLQVDVSDDAVVAAAVGVQRVGIDSPFGWPDAFVDFVTEHHRGDAPAVPLETPEQRRPLVKRHTDLVVARRTLITPLSVSADLIAHVALRCAGLLNRLGVVDRADGWAVEAYPAAALKVWGLPFRGKTSPGGFGGMVAAFREATPWLDLGKFTPEVETHHDAFDAVITAMLARAVALGVTYAPEPDERVVAQREGWIHVPSGPLSDLIGQAGPTDAIT